MFEAMFLFTCTASLFGFAVSVMLLMWSYDVVKEDYEELTGRDLKQYLLSRVIR